MDAKTTTTQRAEEIERLVTVIRDRRARREKIRPDRYGVAYRPRKWY